MDPWAVQGLRPRRRGQVRRHATLGQAAPLACCALAAVSVSLGAQATPPIATAQASGVTMITMAPGDARLQAARLAERTDTVELVRVRDTTRTLLSTVIRTWRRQIERGRAVWVYSQEYRRAGGVTVDTSVVDAATLEPVRYAARIPGERHEVVFGRDSIHGRVIPDSGAPRPVRAAPGGAVFNAVADDLLLAALPLGEGRAYRYRAYNPPRAMVSTELRVAGSEWLRVTGADVDTWVVEYRSAGAPTTIWVDKRSGHVLRKRSRLPDGSDFWQLRRM